MFVQEQGDFSEEERLLVAIAEQLKFPLLQIARSAELGRQHNIDQHANIEAIAEASLKLVDGYILANQLSRQQLTLELEPVSISSVLHDTAHNMYQLAKQYDCELQMHLAGKYGPVMAHKPSLEIALTNLTHAFIEASAKKEKAIVLLAAHRSRNGIVTGIFGDHSDLTTDMYRRAKHLYGRARQPLPTVSATNGAGIYLADSLLQAMSSRLNVAHHHKLTGLAATFLPSRQLQLI